MNFNYKPGLYEVDSGFVVYTVPYYGDDKGWFPLPSGKVKGSSTHVRLVGQKGGLVVHDGVVDWDSTYFFAQQDLHRLADDLFEKLNPKPKTVADKVLEKNRFVTVEKYYSTYLPSKPSNEHWLRMHRDNLALLRGKNAE